jgi:phosphopantetheinyl transferase
MNRNLPGEQGGTIATLQGMMISAPYTGVEIDIVGCKDDKTLSEANLLSLLPDDEQIKVRALTDPVERRHLLFRRCFQRVFLAGTLGWRGRICDLKIEHKLDSPPRLPDAPSLKFSFSSSGTTVLACASARCLVGIDIERIRTIQDPVGLSKRFFTLPEAEKISQLPENAQSLAFLHYWTAKEAGLKAVGRRIDSGLNSFVVTLGNGLYVAEYTDEKSGNMAWTLQYLEFPGEHLVAFMHRQASS